MGETVFGRQFIWGGCLLKSNGGVQRLANFGWKPKVSYKCISQLNCKAYKPSRYESRY